MKWTKSLKLISCVFAIALSISGCIRDNLPGQEGGTGGAGAAGGAGGTGGTGGVRPPDCEPGTMFPAGDGCNTCQCPESGIGAEATCTERACEARCVPGDFFPDADDCNTCQCPENGIRSEAACTDRPCRNPCDGVACGDDCWPDWPNDRHIEGTPEGAPDQARALHVCNGAGACVMEGRQPLECEQPKVCEGLNCGARCFPDMNESDGDRMAPVQERVFACDADLNCVPVDSEPIECNDLCSGRRCGEPCRSGSVAVNGGEAGAQAEPDRAAGAELCDGDGQCVFVFEGEELVCDRPDASCSGVECGDSCYLDEASMDGDADGASGEPPSNGLVAPDGLCDVRGQCQPAADPSDLMCDDPELCRPGITFPAGDGCNFCDCPASGRRDEAACTRMGCGPDPSCEDLECGDYCNPGHPDGTPSNPSPDGAARVAPAQAFCDANLRCVYEYDFEGCGM